MDDFNLQLQNLFKKPKNVAGEKKKTRIIFSIEDRLLIDEILNTLEGGEIGAIIRSKDQTAIKRFQCWSKVAAAFNKESQSGLNLTSLQCRTFFNNINRKLKGTSDTSGTLLSPASNHKTQDPSSSPSPLKSSSLPSSPLSTRNITRKVPDDVDTETVKQKSSRLRITNTNSTNERVNVNAVTVDRQKKAVQHQQPIKTGKQNQKQNVFATRLATSQTKLIKLRADFYKARIHAERRRAEYYEGLMRKNGIQYNNHQSFLAENSSVEENSTLAEEEAQVSSEEDNSARNTPDASLPEGDTGSPTHPDLDPLDAVFVVESKADLDLK